MLSELFKYIGESIKASNTWIDSYAVNCVSIPIKEGDKIINRIVNFEGEEKTEFSFDDSKGYSFYIKTNPRFTYSNGRRITSCDSEYQKAIDFTFVFYAINSDKDLSAFRLENLFADNLRLMNFASFTGTERNVRINILNTNPNAIDVFKQEIGRDLDSGSTFVCISVNARLLFDMVSPTCEDSCLEDLIINSCTNEEFQ